MSLLLALLVALVVFAILKDQVFFLFFASLLMTTLLFLKFEAKFEKVDDQATLIAGKVERIEVRIDEANRKADQLIEQGAR
jgi:uncharacterized protein (DUF58 family)